jgi:hypothetical protein
MISAPTAITPNRASPFMLTDHRYSPAPPTMDRAFVEASAATETALHATRLSRRRATECRARCSFRLVAGTAPRRQYSRSCLRAATRHVRRSVGSPQW